MQPSIGIPIGLVALVLSVSGTLARTGTTITDLGLRAGPSSNTDLLLTMPAGVKVYVGACSGPCCKVSWSGHSGYAIKSGSPSAQLPPHALPRAQSTRRPARSCRSIRPIPSVRATIPRPTGISTFRPYTAIEPSFYRRRYFMMAQERNRYRFMPYIFRGGHYGDGGP